MGFELLAVIVHVLQVLADDNVFSHEIAVERRVLRCVERHKVVGHDATATIYRAVLAQRVILK